MRDNNLNKAITKLDICQNNNINTEKAEKELLECIRDLADSDECDLSVDDYASQINMYKKRVGVLSPMPMAALFQILDEEKKVIYKLNELFDSSGISDIFLWYVKLFYVFGTNLEALTMDNRYDFYSHDYPEKHEHAHTGFDIDHIANRYEYAKAWVKELVFTINSLYEAFDDNNIIEQRLYISNLFYLALETAYICD